MNIIALFCIVLFRTFCYCVFIMSYGKGKNIFYI